MKITKILLFVALAAIFALPSYGQLKVAADGKVGIGTSDPARKLEIQGVMMLTNNATYPAIKQSNFLMRHYSDNAVHFGYFNAQSDADNNQVLFGGGAGSQYAATNIGFLTSSNTTTVLGTERMRVTSDGRIRMNTLGASGALTHELNLITGKGAQPGGGPWETVSDARLKNNVKPFTDGLEQILAIKPVTFHYKAETGYEADKEYVGIIAQEMQKVAPYTVHEVKVKIESDDKTTKMPETILTYDGNAVTYMLINAIQEQQAQLTAKDRKIQELEARMDKIEAMLAAGSINPNNPSTNVTLQGTNDAVLKQNAPNPFSENTTIEYTLPKSFGNAYIQITNTQGAVMRKVTLPQEAGPGVLNIKAKELAAGNYVYSLVIDGKVVDTKKMVLVNN